MMMTVKRALYDGRVRGVEQAVEVWKSHHDEAMEARDLEEIVADVNELFSWLSDWQRESWKLLNDSSISKNAIQHGEALRYCYTKAFAIIDLIGACIASCKKAGYSVEGADELEVATKEVRRLYAHFGRAWPFPQTEKMAEGIRAIEQGNWITPEDWLRELQEQDRGECQK